MRTIFSSLTLIILLTGVTFAQSHGASSTTCDGLDGMAFGICNAYCEAMDCDSEEANASAEACLNQFDKFMEITGNEPPCESADPPSIELECPCNSAFSDFFQQEFGNDVSCTTEDYKEEDEYVSRTITLQADVSQGLITARTVANGYADCMSYFGSPDVWVKLELGNFGSNQGDLSELDGMRNAFYIACHDEIVKIATEDFEVECEPYEP